MMRRAAPVAVAVLALVSATAGAQPPDPDADAQHERFELFTGCAPLNLIVEPDPDRPDFTAAVTAAAESRLRAARLFTESPVGTPWLQVHVNRLGTDNRGPFGLDVNLLKMVHDVVADRIHHAQTWHAGAVGTGGDDYIINTLSQHFDQFLAAYLRVNEDACE